MDNCKYRASDRVIYCFDHKMPIVASPKIGEYESGLVQKKSENNLTNRMGQYCLSCN